MKKGIRCLAVVLVMVMMMSFMFTGCSFIEQYVIDDATEYIEGMTDEFAKDPTAIADYSEEEIEIPELDEYQSSILDYGMDEVSFEIESVEYELGEDELDVEIKMSYIEFGDISEELSLGTEDEFADAISDAKAKSKKFKLTLIKDGDDFVFEDLSDISELIFEGYDQICVLDEEGNPYIVNGAFVEAHCIGCFWYDPMSGNPIDGTSIDDTCALQPVFYFDMPLTYTFTIQIELDGEAVASIDVVLDDEVVCLADFSVDEGNVDSLEDGEYTASIVVNGEAIYTSDALTASFA